jgi:hypothetical protein
MTQMQGSEVKPQYCQKNKAKQKKWKETIRVKHSPRHKEWSGTSSHAKVHTHCPTHSHTGFFVCLFVLRWGSHYVPQAELKLIILQPQPLSTGTTGMHYHTQLTHTHADFICIWKDTYLSTFFDTWLCGLLAPLGVGKTGCSGKKQDWESKNHQLWLRQVTFSPWVGFGFFLHKHSMGIQCGPSSSHVH